MSSERPGCKLFLRLGDAAPWAAGRRQMLLALGACLVARSSMAAAQESVAPFDAEEDLRNLRPIDLTDEGHRVLVLQPRYVQPGQRLPLLLLLHGLGETGDPRMGAYAWLERYGLGRAWQRLKRPPLVPLSGRGDWTAERLAEVNASLDTRPFRGCVLACPHLPKLAGSELDAYARWIATRLVPRLRAEHPVLDDPRATGIGGASLGGWASLEVLLRAPGTFGAWAGVQTAIGEFAADGYAARLSAANVRGPLLVLSSTGDPYRAASERLATAMRGRNLLVTSRILPGPHDQPWLRDAGTAEMLLWFDHVTSR